MKRSLWQPHSNTCKTSVLACTDQKLKFKINMLLCTLNDGTGHFWVLKQEERIYIFRILDILTILCMKVISTHIHYNLFYKLKARDRLNWKLNEPQIDYELGITSPSKKRKPTEINVQLCKEMSELVSYRSWTHSYLQNSTEETSLFLKLIFIFYNSDRNIISQKKFISNDFFRSRTRTQQLCNFANHLPSYCTLTRNARTENLPFHSGSFLYLWDVVNF